MSPLYENRYLTVDSFEYDCANHQAFAEVKERCWPAQVSPVGDKIHVEQGEPGRIFVILALNFRPEITIRHSTFSTEPQSFP